MEAEKDKEPQQDKDEEPEQEKEDAAQAIVRELKAELEGNIAGFEKQNEDLRANIANQAPDHDPGEDGPLVGVDLDNARRARIAGNEAMIANLRRQLAQLELLAAANRP